MARAAAGRGTTDTDTQLPRLAWTRNPVRDALTGRQQHAPRRVIVSPTKFHVERWHTQTDYVQHLHSTQFVRMDQLALTGALLGHYLQKFTNAATDARSQSQAANHRYRM